MEKRLTREQRLINSNKWFKQSEDEFMKGHIGEAYACAKQALNYNENNQKAGEMKARIEFLLNDKNYNPENLEK